LLLFLLAGPVGAGLGPASLEDVVRASSLIADVTITSGHVVQWRSDTGPATCGIVFEGVVTQTFKGLATDSVTFATQRPLPVPSRHVVFLRNRPGAFPTDYIPRRSPQAESEYQACLGKLPSLKTSSIFTVHTNADFTYLDPDVISPAEWEQHVHEANLLETSELRDWIIREVSARDR
jgi:hypothetical protein